MGQLDQMQMQTIKNLESFQEANQQAEPSQPDQLIVYSQDSHHQQNSMNLSSVLTQLPFLKLFRPLQVMIQFLALKLLTIF